MADKDTSTETANVYRFVPDVPELGFVNLADDPKMQLLACCIADQQRAGFKELIDLRQSDCACCGAPGFNTGWGVWQFLCGAETLTDGDVSAPCPKGGALVPASGDKAGG